mmetsp:Transcript_70884/g.184018  ORF Transcript_70884/g.184018 Transcript_70884/m.184018 type:complete len:141 (+) Transcript_70884:2-424(+)
MKCFSAALTPEIHHIFEGSKTLEECFKVITFEAAAAKWLLRLIGWAMMYVGLYCMFSPFLTLITVLPWIGPPLAKFGGWLIWLLCGFVTLMVATLIVMVAYLFYHPVVTLVYAVFLAFIVVIFKAIVNFVNQGGISAKQA